MAKKRKFLVAVVIVLAVILAGCIAGALFSRQQYMNNHVFMGEVAYPKNAQQLDLRNEDISLDYYLQLQQKLPQCQIRWNVPFQGSHYDCDTRELTVTALTDGDLEQLSYFANLTTLDARGCADYSQLLKLMQLRPELEVLYQVSIGGTSYPQDTKALSITGLTDADTVMLSYLPQLETLELIDPTAAPEAVQALSQSGIDIRCQASVLGTTVTSADTQLDFSATAISTLSELDALAYFPNLETVFLGECGLDNEALAAYREENRDTYKLVWTVQCGKLKVRTDDTYFMPVKYHVYYFHDEDAYNLRYCEDMICIDLGHMSIHNVEFVRFMPNLKYLILAHTTLLDITPLESCKSLLFLELDWTGIRDYSPLLGCTALEDLNLGNTYGDITPITQMTWLKNLWWIGRNYSFKQSMENQLPNTNKMFDGKHTVSNGWRKLPNYYDMRDLLGMDYM